MMTNSEVNAILRRMKNAKKHWHDIARNDVASQDEKEMADDSFGDINDLINKMCEYTWAVFEDNTKSSIRDDRGMEVEERQEKMMDIERTRKIKHDALITQIKLVDKECRVAGIEEIYGDLPNQFKEDVSGLMGEENRKNPEVLKTRKQIANWTFDFVLSCSIGMYLDLGNLDFDTNPQDFKNVSRGMIGKKVIQEDIKTMTDPEF